MYCATLLSGSDELLGFFFVFVFFQKCNVSRAGSANRLPITFREKNITRDWLILKSHTWSKKNIFFPLRCKSFVSYAK